MKKLTLILLFIVSCVVASYAEYVNGYYRKDGTYVNGYHRTEKNDTVRDNYSHKGNYNPYTNEYGTHKDSNNKTSEYYNGLYK